jgi:hypothetical protein
MELLTDQYVSKMMINNSQKANLKLSSNLIVPENRPFLTLYDKINFKEKMLSQLLKYNKSDLLSEKYTKDLSKGQNIDEFHEHFGIYEINLRLKLELKNLQASRILNKENELYPFLKKGENLEKNKNLTPDGIFFRENLEKEKKEILEIFDFKKISYSSSLLSFNNFLTRSDIEKYENKFENLTNCIIINLGELNEEDKSNFLKFIQEQIASNTLNSQILFSLIKKIKKLCLRILHVLQELILNHLNKNDVYKKIFQLTNVYTFKHETIVEQLISNIQQVSKNRLDFRYSSSLFEKDIKHLQESIKKDKL